MKKAAVLFTIMALVISGVFATALFLSTILSLKRLLRPRNTRVWYS